MTGGAYDDPSARRGSRARDISSFDSMEVTPALRQQGELGNLGRERIR